MIVASKPSGGPAFGLRHTATSYDDGATTVAVASIRWQGPVPFAGLASISRCGIDGVGVAVDVAVFVGVGVSVAVPVAVGV